MKYYINFQLFKEGFFDEIHNVSLYKKIINIQKNFKYLKLNNFIKQLNYFEKNMVFAITKK